MARTKGMLNLSGNLEVNAGAPLDARSVVPTIADLTVAANFQYKYVGMTVVVQATGDMYILTANDVTVAANWKQVGSGGGGSSYTAGDGIVIDNDEISTDNMPAADMSEIVTPLPSVMSRLPILFDETGEERIVGWYKDSNGNMIPVYEKCLTGTTIKGSQTIAIGITIDKLVFCDAYIKASGPIAFHKVGSDISSISISKDKSSVLVYINYADGVGKPVNIIIRYTKPVN